MTENPYKEGTKEWYGWEGLMLCRRSAIPQCDALIDAGWKFELPNPELEPWQWSWRRPPLRKGQKGRRFTSTNQAFNAMKRGK